MSPSESSNDQPLPDAGVDRNQPPLVQIEVLELIAEAGHVQGAVEIVDPGMIRALKAGNPALRLGDKGGAAMPAEVEEGADVLIVVPHHDDILAAELGEEILPLEEDVLVPADADPTIGIPGFLLVREDLRVVIDLGRQEGGAAHIGPYRGDRLRRHRSGIRPIVSSRSHHHRYGLPSPNTAGFWQG
jgi:hypothetical protein